MPANAAAAAAPPPRYDLRRALMSVAPLVPWAAVRPFDAGAEPARASDGSTAVSASAATVTMAAVRPSDENRPFRANISVSSVTSLADTSPDADVGFPWANASTAIDGDPEIVILGTHRPFRFAGPEYVRRRLGTLSRTTARHR